MSFYPKAKLFIRLSEENNDPEVPNFGQQVGNCASLGQHQTTHIDCSELRDLGWEALMFPPYTPVLALSDNYLFLSVVNDLAISRFGFIVRNTAGEIGIPGQEVTEIRKTIFISDLN